MEQGLRVVGTVEFGGLENPLSKSRIKNLILNAKDMLNGLPENEDHEDEWHQPGTEQGRRCGEVEQRRAIR